MFCYSLYLLRHLSIFLALISTSLAGSSTEGDVCSPLNDRIDNSTHKFVSDCDDRAFCLPTKPQNASSQDNSSNSSVVNLGSFGSCTKRLCRKDEFPFGFARGEQLPLACAHGFFCPDNGSGCQPLLPVGALCDMDRDYQCAPSDNWNLTASEWNFNGSVCLKSTCMYANVTIGLSCILERISYAGYNHDNTLYNVTVSRDNCLSTWPKLYCGATTSVCERMKKAGAPCGDDRECYSRYCSSSTNVCSEPPGMPAKVKSWQYALTTLSVLGAVSAICTFLVLGHKRQRMDRYYELLEYYHEQTSLRASIISLHTAAARRLSKRGLHAL